MRGKIRTYQIRRKGNNRTDTEGNARRIAYVSALFLCSVLCGCTRREQLVLQVNEAAQENVYETQEGDVTGVQESETAGLQGDTASGIPDSRILEAAGQAGITGAEGGALTGTQALQAQQSTQEQSPAVICVHVCGAVKHPGVYELAADSRVYEAVEQAGGFAETADESYVNQAERLKDGVKLVIPTTEQTAALSEQDTAEIAGIGIIEGKETEKPAGQADGEIAGTTVSESNASDGKININTASETELCNIPGIGSTRAAAIVAYRQERGCFQSIEDIMNVSGIKQGTYDKIKDKIKVN
ncbi:MAG: helix-hairpin-helix domain-containing protein [Eubacterium sp.]|nr:helix-hairpin-helix domain-containing protein [Eubacterium sp.]